jgi:hypothetical protein
MLSFLVKSLSDVETNIVSVERISEFSNVEQEVNLFYIQSLIPNLGRFG